MPPTLLFLPISRLQAEALSRPGADWEALLSSWSIPSIAASLVIQAAANAFGQAYRMRTAKSSTQPCKAKTWCALTFKWAPVLAF